MEQVLPGVIIDGAHNEAGAQKVLKTARLLGGGCSGDSALRGGGRQGLPAYDRDDLLEPRLGTCGIVTEVGGYRSVHVRKPECFPGSSDRSR